jgi:hypothetical protein
VILRYYNDRSSAHEVVNQRDSVHNPT